MLVLKEAGYDVICEKSTQNKYFIGKRSFDDAEIKMLCDAVSAAHFITEKQTTELIEKLLKNVSVYTAKRIKPMIQSPTGSKVSDSSIYVADMINYAISNKKQIQFQYFEYNEKKDKILKHNGYIYEVSPTFYAWIFQFEGDIIIQSPLNAIDDFIKTAEMIIEVHKRKGTIITKYLAKRNKLCYNMLVSSNRCML